MVSQTSNVAPENAASENPAQDPNTIINAVNWQKVDNLLPVIVQDYVTAEVLMLGFMNEEALQKTFSTNKVNFLNVVDYTLDCDQDTLLILAKPIGSTCHLGTTSCFESASKTAPWVFFSRLEKLLESRKNEDPGTSYTASLYAKGTKRIAQKVGEEGVEVALAATVHDKDEVVSEMADLLYHATVLLHDQGLAWEDVLAKLNERHSK